MNRCLFAREPREEEALFVGAKSFIGFLDLSEHAHDPNQFKMSSERRNDIGPRVKYLSRAGIFKPQLYYAIHDVGDVVTRGSPEDNSEILCDIAAGDNVFEYCQQCKFYDLGAIVLFSI
jgi:hypothetical protein